MSDIFYDVPSTSIFRTLQSHVKVDFGWLKDLLQSESVHADINDFEKARDIVDRYLQITKSIPKIGQTSNPYTTLLPSNHPVDFWQHEDNGYDENYRQYLMILLPNFVGERYFEKVVFDLPRPLNRLALHVYVLDKTTVADFSLKQQAIKEIKHFEAMLDAIAEFERQQFGEDANEMTNIIS